jgi:hypothetical protein
MIFFLFFVTFAILISAQCDGIGEEQCAAASTTTTPPPPPSVADWNKMIEQKCTELEEKQRKRNEIIIARFTVPALDLIHRGALRCELPFASASCNHSDYFFSETFRFACGRGSPKRPCRPAQLPASPRSFEGTAERIAQHCKTPDAGHLSFACTNRDSIEDIADLDNLLNADVVLFDGTNNRVWGEPAYPSALLAANGARAPRCPSQLWGMWEFRPSSVYPFLRDPSYIDDFNFTIGYSRNWTIFAPDFVPPHYFYTRIQQPKTASALVVAFISQCNTPNNRLHYLTDLMRHIEVHSYGKCAHNRDLPAELQDVSNKYSQKAAVIGAYKFTIAFENSDEPDYVSEKVYNALAEGSVPIYMGAPNIERFTPSHSIIPVTDFDSPSALAEYLKYLATHENEYERYLDWKRRDAEEHMVQLQRASRLHMECHVCKFADDFLTRTFERRINKIK